MSGGRAVVVFGATSAIAAATVARLAARGDRLFLVGRTPVRLEAVVAANEAAVVGSLAADLTDLDALEGIVARAIDALGGLDLALVCHGLLPDQLRTEDEITEALRTYEVNLLSAVGLLIPVARHMEQTGRGHIAVLTSVAADRGRPRNYTYGSAKAALNTYLQGVRSRLYRAGVRVTVIKPGPVHSPMTEGHPKNALFATPERVARDIERALDQKRRVAYVPWFWFWIMAIVRNLPEPVFQRFGFLSGR